MLRWAGKVRAPEQGWTQAQRATLWLTLLCMTVAVGMLAFGAIILLQGRQDAWTDAERASTNLVVALERDIARNITNFDLSLRGARDSLALPGIDAASPEIRQAALFDRAATAEYLASIVVLSPSGRVVWNSTTHPAGSVDFSDREYFQFHRDHADPGLFVSRPYASRLRNGTLTIGISRRLFGPDGDFAGLVVGGLKLRYFQDIFEQLNVGRNGSLALFRTDGRLLARHPGIGGEIDRDASGSEVFRKALATPSGSFTATAEIDRTERLYTVRHLVGLPLILAIGVSTEDIYAPWRHRALVIGGILAMLCTATVGLCLMVRAEMLRRMGAERALLGRAQTLAVMAATDGLTGLGNRRAFEVEYDRSWRHAVRSQTPLTLLMVDADSFKRYNDEYGHPAGDRVLRGIGTCIQQTLRRPRDLGARYGGEEFVVLLPETGTEGGLDVAERIRAGVAALDIPHVAGPQGRVSISIGVATAFPTVEDRDSALLKAADQALYRAKATGRNRVCVAEHAMAPEPQRTAA